MIMLLLPVRIYIIPRLSFTKEELAILDGPTASSFVSLCPHSVDHRIDVSRHTLPLGFI